MCQTNDIFFNLKFHNKIYIFKLNIELRFFKILFLSFIAFDLFFHFICAGTTIRSLILNFWHSGIYFSFFYIYSNSSFFS